MKRPDANDILREGGPDALRAAFDDAQAGAPHLNGTANGQSRGAAHDARPHILDPRDPMPSARALVQYAYTAHVRTLHHHRGAFYEWSGACYRSADQDAVRSATWTFLEQALTPQSKPFQPNRARVGDVLAALAAICNLPARIEPPAWLRVVDGPPASELLPVHNGLLHLPSGSLYPSTPDYFGFNATDVVFDDVAPEPAEWLQFLAQLWPDDPESITTLQEVFGCALTPDTSHQKIVLLVGPMRSGKGTIARVLTRLLGQDNVAAPTLASLATNFGLAPLIGKPLAIVGDARLGSRTDQAAISERLLSISGEDSLTIDRKFLPAWTGRLSTRFLIITNELPRIADASGALASRFIVLTLNQSFLGREDRGLFNRLGTEMPGVLNWARQGYIRLRERGYFVQPESARDAIEELETLSSPVGAFVKECCIVGPGHRVERGRLFNEWTAWCGEHNRREPGTMETFGRDLRAVVPGLSSSRPRDGGARIRVHEGVGLR